jgi:precorrin-2 methylase
MPPTQQPTFDIAIMGMGIQSIDHLTLEAIEVLAACHNGFVVSLGQEALDAFRTALQSRIGTLHTIPPLQSLSPAYSKDRLRSENYHEAARMVLDAAARATPVAFLTPGHPMVFDSVAQNILEATRRHNYKVRIVNGISSIDTVLACLQEELAPGLQILDATIAMTHNITLDPRIACLLLQTSVLGTLYPTADKAATTQSWRRLRDYLTHFYPTTHPVHAVRSENPFTPDPAIHTTTIANLATHPEAIPIGASLYIPAISPNKRTNRSDKTNRSDE